MTDKQIKVGDVVAWDKVPSGALVRGPWDKRDYFIERPRWRYWVKNENNAWWAAEEVAPALRAANLDTLVTIIDLDVPADATAEHLRELAEVFEVREAVMRDASLWANEFTLEDLEDAVVTLHRAGWKPGMTAEDAARLLSK